MEWFTYAGIVTLQRRLQQLRMEMRMINGNDENRKTFNSKCKRIWVMRLRDSDRIFPVEMSLFLICDAWNVRFPIEINTFSMISKVLSCGSAKFNILFNDLRERCMECEEFRGWSTHRNRSTAIKAYARVNSNLSQSSTPPTNSVSFFFPCEFEPRILLQKPGSGFIFITAFPGKSHCKMSKCSPKTLCTIDPPSHIGGSRRNCLHFIKNIFSPILCSRFACTLYALRGASFGALQSNYSCRASFFCRHPPLCAISEFRGWSHLFSHLRSRSGVRKAVMRSQFSRRARHCHAEMSARGLN